MSSYTTLNNDVELGTAAGSRRKGRFSSILRPVALGSMVAGAAYMVGYSTHDSVSALVGGGSKDDISPPGMKLAPEDTNANCGYRGVWNTDVQECRCYECYTGADCSEEVDECIINAVTGQPFLMQEFWVNYTRDRFGDVPQLSSVPLEYRIPYGNAGTNLNQQSARGLDRLLVDSIVDLHAKYQNAITEGYRIVVGTGATQLWNAAMYASAARAGRQLSYFERKPYYFGHPSTVSPNSYAELSWLPEGEGTIMNPGLLRYTEEEDLDPANVLEILTWPGNPAGYFMEPIYPDAQGKIFDVVYNWPHLTPNMRREMNEDIMIYSLTKLSGHAGSRFGWALVRDPQIASSMSSYISALNLGGSVENRWRATQIMKQFVDNDDFTEAVGGAMTERWERLEAMFERCPRFTNKSQKGTAYIYADCNWDGAACPLSMAAYGIYGMDGTRFGDREDIFRINLTLHSHIFDILEERLTLMCNEQEEDVRAKAAELLRGSTKESRAAERLATARDNADRGLPLK